MPPKVAQTQFVVIPIFSKDDDIEGIKAKAHDLATSLKEQDMRVAVDDQEGKTPGFKFNHWELRGTPVRVELGPKDYAKQEVRVVIRHSGEKIQVNWDGFADTMEELLPKIHQQMYDKAL